MKSHQESHLKGTVNEKLSDFAKFLFFTRTLDTTLMSKFTKKIYKIIKRTDDISKRVF